MSWLGLLFVWRFRFATLNLSVFMAVGSFNAERNDKYNSVSGDAAIKDFENKVLLHSEVRGTVKL